MNSIKYIIGDATAPKMDGTKIICHVCNVIGGWGKGFVLALSKLLLRRLARSEGRAT